MLLFIQLMKSITAFFNNYSISQVAYNINTNTSIDRVQCERNKCDKELHRLRYELENLFGNKDQIQKKSSMDRCWPCCRRWNRNRHDGDTSTTKDFRESSVSTPALPYIDRTKRDLRQNITDSLPNKTIPDPTYKSLLFKNLQVKLLDCLRTSPRYFFAFVYFKIFSCSIF